MDPIRFLVWNLKALALTFAFILGLKMGEFSVVCP